MKEKNKSAILYAVAAAVFYGINMPFSKMLLKRVPATVMAGLLYLGAGIGIGMLYLFHSGNIRREEKLSKNELPYTVGMVVLDILAPILLMYGLAHTNSATASLLNNFEIAATALIALLLFQEAVSARLWIAIFFVTMSSILLSVEDFSGLKLSCGALFVLLAAVCWGLENNCTRKLAAKNTYQIVMIKGLCSGLGSLIIGFAIGEKLPPIKYLFLVLLLGYIAYGLSIFFYIKAQKYWLIISLCEMTNQFKTA